MLIAALVMMLVAGLVIFLFYRYAQRIPKQSLKLIGYFLVAISCIESVLIIWLLLYVWNSEWALWDISMNDFWREQLSAIYFVKEWLYSWMWNNLLDLFLVILPAIVFLGIRTTTTTILGFWSLALAKK